MARKLATPQGTIDVAECFEQAGSTPAPLTPSTRCITALYRLTAWPLFFNEVGQIARETEPTRMRQPLPPCIYPRINVYLRLFAMLYTYIYTGGVLR